MSDPAVQTPEESTITLADVLEQMLNKLQEVEEKVDKLNAAHEELDREIHEDFFGPIHKQYTAQVRGQGIESLKSRIGSRFDPLAEPLKAFGIDDLYGRLYDTLEELKKGEGWKDEQEGPWFDDIFNQAQERISKVRGKPSEPPKEEKPAVSETVVEVKGEKPITTTESRTRARSPRMDL